MRFLPAAEMFAMWLVAVPLGVLGGLVFRLPAFYTDLFLHSDQMIKAVWCVFRLHSGRWIKKSAPIPTRERQAESPLCEPQNTL